MYNCGIFFTPFPNYSNYNPLTKVMPFCRAYFILGGYNLREKNTENLLNWDILVFSDKSKVLKGPPNSNGQKMEKDLTLKKCHL